MLKKSFFALLFFLATLHAGTTFAALDLELTQGVRAAIPIAILPFANQQQAIAPGQQMLTQIMTKDLDGSGQFRVETPDDTNKAVTDAAQVNLKYWRQQRVNDVVLGSVQPKGNGKYQVNVQLVAVYQQAQTDSKQTVLLNETFTVKKAALRQLAHHFSDLIYQKITGVRGIFSTKLAYILVQQNLGQKPKYDLVVSDYDGFDPQVLLSSAEPIMSPVWSPDGKQIAYVSFEGHQAAIYLQDLASGKRWLLSRQPGINGAPAFSPDGKKMALVLTLTGNPKIYLMDLRNRRLKQLTFGYAIDTEPSFAPDGKSLLFTSSRGGSPQVYRYIFATRKVQRVTFDGNYNAHASFMPDEQAIVMMHRQTSIYGGLMFTIARQSLDSGQVQILTRAGADESPSLAPNGKMIIYATQYGGRGVLAMVSTDGNIKLRLPATDGKVQEPAWSPFL